MAKSVTGHSNFQVFGFSGFRFPTLNRGHVKSMTLGFTRSESGQVVLALVVPLDTPWLPLVCPWGTKVHRHGQPRAAKGRLLCALGRQNTNLLHVLLMHFQVSGFRVFKFSGSDS